MSGLIDRDQPMPLGHHLDELRRRLIWPLITLAVGMVVAFLYQAQLMLMLVWPLERAVQLASKDAATLGLPLEGHRLLTVLNLTEGAMAAAWVSAYVAIAVAIPVALWHAWQFIAVGLKPHEKRLVFLFVPAGVICFYIGCVLGYLFALPWFYAFLISFTATNPTIHLDGFRLSEYVDTFFLWTIVFGVVMDIPWATVCVVRTGLVRPATIARFRKYIFFANVVLAMCLVPDAVSASILALAMHLLFELGLLLSHLFVPKPAPG